MDYRDFRVTIADRSTIHIVNPDGILIQPDPKVPMDRLRERTINVLTRYVKEDSMKSREELMVLGSHLFSGLFDEDASRAFTEELFKVKRRKQNAVLRLVLEFSEEARELAQLPWEYLYFPDSLHQLGKGFFIAADPESRLILARRVPMTIDHHEATPQPLRILIVVSQPEKYPDGVEPLPAVMAGPVIEGIKKLEEDSKGAIHTDELRQPTKRSLEERIGTFEPQVVHFLCHGKYEEGKGGSLAFVQERDEKTLAWVTDEDLPACLRPSPRLIFLHACEGAHSDSYEAFRGVALQLVYSRVPAVVAMQYQVENKVANRFALKFYESLGQGKRIDEAVQDGRRELGMYLKDDNFSSRAFGSPVVFLQSADGIVQIPQAVVEDTTVEASVEQPSAGPAAIRCTRCNGAFVSARGFCESCGAMYVVCEHCGEWTGKSSRYCSACGKSRDTVAGHVGSEAPHAAAEPSEASGYAKAAGSAGSGTQLAVVRPLQPKPTLESPDGQ